MANIYIQSDKSKLGLIYYRKSLKLKLQSSMASADYRDLAIVYNNIGNAYSILSNYKMALKKYEKALDLVLKETSSNAPVISEYRANIAFAKRHLLFTND
jgi:tetratricopeptide (TPR) repeat protein